MDNASLPFAKACVSWVDEIIYLSGTADNSDTAEGISLIADGDMLQEPYTQCTQQSSLVKVTCLREIQMIHARFLWGSSGRRRRRKMKGSLTAMRVACRQCSNGLPALVLSENRQEEIPSSHNLHLLTISETSHILTKILRHLGRGISRNIWTSGKLWWTAVVFNVTLCHYLHHEGRTWVFFMIWTKNMWFFIG